jgi:hypothetical protein
MRMLVALIMTTIVAAPVFAQSASDAPRPGATVTPMPAGVRPLRGQTPEQTQIDVAQCRNVASEATGFVPGAGMAMPQASNAPGGARLRGAAVGAGVGAIVGDAGVGAATGAVAGGMNQRQSRRMSAAQQQQAAAAQAQLSTAWTNSNVGCLQSRGYAVEKPPVAAPAG